MTDLFVCWSAFSVLFSDVSVGALYIAWTTDTVSRSLYFTHTIRLIFLFFSLILNPPPLTPGFHRPISLQLTYRVAWNYLPKLTYSTLPRRPTLTSIGLLNTCCLSLMVIITSHRIFLLCVCVGWWGGWLVVSGFLQMLS